jgi:hypothetical protein
MSDSDEQDIIDQPLIQRSIDAFGFDALEPKYFITVKFAQDILDILDVLSCRIFDEI